MRARGWQGRGNDHNVGCEAFRGIQRERNECLGGIRMALKNGNTQGLGRAGVGQCRTAWVEGRG